MQAKSKTVVVLSDLHIGSTLGLWPHGFVANEGFPIGQNKFQKWLWSCWLDCMAWVQKAVGDDPFEIVFNGDLVEGIHHRTTQVMSADVGDQCSAVTDVISGLSRLAERVFVVQGTEVHTRNDECRIGKALDAVKDSETGKHAFDRLLLTVNGCHVSFAHHMQTTIRPYLEASQHSINLGTEIIESARSGQPIPSVIVRAHRHLHGVWSDGVGMSISTGAWQGITRFGRKVVPHAVPRPSCVILDWRNRAKGELPLVHEKLYCPR